MKVKRTPEELKAFRAEIAQKARDVRAELLATEGYRENLKQRQAEKKLERMNAKHEGETLKGVISNYIKQQGEIDRKVSELASAVSELKVTPPPPQPQPPKPKPFVKSVSKYATSESEFSDANVLKGRATKKKDIDDIAPQSELSEIETPRPKRKPKLQVETSEPKRKPKSDVPKVLALPKRVKNQELVYMYI